MRPRRLDAVPRRCTDGPFLVVFLVANALLLYVAIFGTADSVKSYRKIRGKLRRYDGRICGGKGKNVRDLPFLFFCGRRGAGNTTDLIFELPLCLESCPSSADTGRDCIVDASGGTEWLLDYPTQPFQNQLCFPLDRSMQDAWSKWVEGHYPQLYSEMVWDTWWVLALVAGFSMALSLCYLFFLNQCAGYFVWTTVGVLAVVPWLLTAYCAFCWQTGGCDALPISRIDHIWNTVAFALIGVSTTSIIFFEQKSISNAVQVLMEACRCMFEARSLLVEPLLHLSIRVAFVLGFVHVFLRLVTSGWHHTDQGVVYSRYTGLQWAEMVLVLVMFVWHMQLLAAVSSFAIMYVTWLWYFDEDSDEDVGKCACCLPWRGLFRAYWYALRYHAGTLALAALVLGFTSPFRAVLGPLASCSHVDGNLVSCCLQQVCCCFIELYESCFKAVDFAALMEVVLGSKPWCAACRNSLRIGRLQESTVTFLNGVTKLFKLAGVVATMYLGMLVALYNVQRDPQFTQLSSPSFVMKPSFVYLVAALVAGAVAMPFHFAYDSVGNAILYCWTIQYHTQVMHEQQQARSQRSCMNGLGNVLFCTPSTRPGHRY